MLYFAFVYFESYLLLSFRNCCLLSEVPKDDTDGNEDWICAEYRGRTQEKQNKTKHLRKLFHISWHVSSGFVTC